MEGTLRRLEPNIQKWKDHGRICNPYDETLRDADQDAHFQHDDDRLKSKFPVLCAIGWMVNSTEDDDNPFTMGMRIGTLPSSLTLPPELPWGEPRAFKSANVEVIEQIKFDILNAHSEMVRAECTMWADAHCQPPGQMGLEEDEDGEGVDLGEFADGGRVEPDENTEMDNRFVQCSVEGCTAFRDKNFLLCSRHLKNRRTEYMDKELAKRLVRVDTATATCQKYYVKVRYDA